MAPARWTLPLLFAAAAVCVVAAWRFRRTQNEKHALGGRISTPKLIWLFFAVWFWFCECPTLALDPSLPRGARIVLGAHGASMWLRGAAELIMLYVTKNWRPPIGITHDVVCIATLLGLSVAFRGELTGGALGVWPLALLGALLLSLVVEIIYAALFFRAVEGRTTGHDGIWFAEDDPRFRRINRLTTTFNVPLLLFQAAFVTRLILAVG